MPFSSIFLSSKASFLPATIPFFIAVLFVVVDESTFSPVMSTPMRLAILFVLFVCLGELFIIPAISAMVQAIFCAVATVFLSFFALLLLAVSLFGCQGNAIPTTAPPPQSASSPSESCHTPHQAESSRPQDACAAKPVEEDWDFLGFVTVEESSSVTEEKPTTWKVCDSGTSFLVPPLQCGSLRNHLRHTYCVTFIYVPREYRYFMSILVCSMSLFQNIPPFSPCLHQSPQPEAELPKSHFDSEDKADEGAHSATGSTPYPTGEPEFEAFNYHASFWHTEVPSTLHFSNILQGSRTAITRYRNSVYILLLFLLFPFSACISIFLHQLFVFVARRFLDLIRSSRLSLWKWTIQPMSNMETTRRTQTLLRHPRMTRMSIAFRWVMTIRGPVLALSISAEHCVFLTLSSSESSSLIS